MRKLLVILTVLILCGSIPLATGCHPRLARTVVAAAIITAAIVGTAHVLAYHDAHYHDEYCGHHRRYHDDRWVYYYEDRWEYYDPHTGRWYYYHETY